MSDAICQHAECCTYRLCAHPKCCGYRVQSAAPELDLLACLRQVIGDEAFLRAQSAPRLRDASDYDEDSLRRSFGGLSRTARREQRRPLMPRDNEPWADEMGRCTEGGLRDVG